ncbi:MAG TPA: hypothetical protein VGK47_06605 [Nitrososphaeraceae archaeon]
MPRIHRITHDNELVRRKVNFFADYFVFAAETAGTNDLVEIDNALSTTDKIIFQITKNPNRCSAYIDSYLTHVSFEDYDDFKNHKVYQKLQSLIIQYAANKKPKHKINWVQSKPEFLKVLKLYRRELKRIMFKKALNSIISYLRCVHEIEEHKSDLINQTNIIVSEFILNDRSKRDIAGIFERIITREVGIFPFPKFVKNQDEKENFIKNRTFHQQFDGIYNFLKEKLNENYFLFRIYGLKTPDNFEFTYNRVTFYSSKHEKLQVLLNKIREDKYNADFLVNDEYLMFATIKSEYGSIDAAVSFAIEAINTELKFINKVFASNCTLEKFSYLLTSNFVDIGYHRNLKDKGHRIDNNEGRLLEDNPYVFLKKSPKRFTEVLLKNESIYIEALTNRNIATYWQYLETIIPSKQNDEKQIIDIVSHLLLLNADSYYKNRLKGYIIDAISPLTANHDDLGITIDRQLEIFNSQKSIDWTVLSTEIKHPFISHLIADFLKPLKKNDLVNRRKFYQRVLWDTQAQRNSIIHRGYANEKAMISLNGSLPRLITRLRWTLFNGIREKVGLDYNDMVLKLRDRASLLV